MIDAYSIRRNASTTLLLAAVAALMGLTGCQQSGTEGSGATETNLVPAIRLVGTRYMTGGLPSVNLGQYITIDGVIRPTLTGSHPFLFQPSCTPVEGEEDLVECDLTLPIQVAGPRWAIVETSLPPAEEPSAEVGDERERAPEEKMRILTHGPGRGGDEPFTVRLPAASADFFAARLMPDLANRGVLTDEIVLPEGGSVLRTWIGIEEAAWIPHSAPIVFSVSVVHKNRVDPERIFEKVLDPARNPDQQTWVPVEIPLPDLGSEVFHLLFETLPQKENDPNPSLPVWGDPTILRPETKRQRPRHVVLVSLDTLRARSMSAYGHDRPTTPLFEKMLDEGTLFENAFTTFSNTLGSHMSMMTGLYPANHRVRASNLKLDNAIPTLAIAMRDSGYETAAFTENALLRAEAGFQRGFSYYSENKDIEDGAGDAAETFRRALDWAKAQPDEPLFLFVHTYEVHSPYLPPDYTEGFAGEAAPPASHAEVIRDLYEREIVHLDRLLADFVTELTSIAPPGELLLLITADHGEEFMEHGFTAHMQLFDEVMQVPLFLRWPGHIPAGEKIATPVSLVDLVPTIIEFTGGNPLPTDGTSLVPLLEGDALDRTIVFGQTARGKRTEMKSTYVARSTDAKCMVRDVDGDWVECFDLAADPMEAKPLAPGTSPALAALHAEVLRHKQEATRDIAGQEAEKELVAGDEADPARREKLRVLGYVE
ncbi:MAG: sulfatase [Candidatus Binatia bacterium]|nr:sulfatase [Candidatus Binatia bacterium]